ncbi:hypothetical protein [Amycolatopsis orientalis]|uniref:hypothetical protein n=1 Tax=Amycolatopsis orientalis TaxID=31958 RepID=UPI00041A78C0|nr:hypothetical protein [Amycolatopsis orientalis]
MPDKEPKGRVVLFPAVTAEDPAEHLELKAQPDYARFQDERRAERRRWSREGDREASTGPL